MRKKIWIAIIVLLTVVLAVVLWLVSRSHRRNQEKTLRIGAVLPLTGSSARYGKWISEGLDIAVEQVNAAGGINGNRLEIIYEDDQALPAPATSAMQKLVDVDKVPCVFGSWASSSVLAQAPIAEQSKTVLMAEAISPQIRDAGDYVFRIQPDARYYLKELVPFVFQQLNMQSAAILYVNNDFGVDQAEVFKTGFAQLGGKIVATESYLPNATDFRTQLTKVISAKPQVLFLPGYAEVGTILKQAKELGLSCQFVGSVPTENPDLINVAGLAAEGIIYPSHFDPDSPDPAIQAFQTTYKAKYGHAAEGFAALAYDGLMIIASGLKPCGANSTCLKDYLYSVKDYKGVTGTTSFDEKGDVVKPIIIKVVREGRFQVYR
jgi:branched-chain amino acid transport system substrate-binding protein